MRLNFCHIPACALVHDFDLLILAEPESVPPIGRPR